MASKGSIDSTQRPLKSFESDEPRNDRFNFREKGVFKEREAGERGRPDGRMGAFNVRPEDWKDGRPRRTFATDDPERKPRRNGEFDRWEGRDGERGGRDKDGRFPVRKDGQPGRRFEGNWFRDDNAQDGLEAEEGKSPARTREWRRERPAPGPDWHRGSKFEQEPEWLGTTEPEEPRRAHTQEDFERWKERMKAGSGQVEEKKEPTPEKTASTQKAEARPTDGEMFSHNGPPMQADMTMERFFGLLGEKKSTPGVGSPSPMESPGGEKAPGRLGKSSRFAGFFSPTPEAAAAKETQSAAKTPPPSNPPSNDADQEGFQRILQMLGGSKSQDATPHNEHSQPVSRPMQAEPGRELPSPAGPLNHPDTRDLQDRAPAQSGPDYDENDPRAGRDQLLRLMQQVRVDPNRNAVPNQAQHGPPPGLMNMPDVMPPPGIPPSQKGSSFMDDPAIANMSRAEGRRPPMGYFEDSPFLHHAQGPMTPGGSRSQGPSTAMGMQRPPGFENMAAPPGWTGQPPPQQGGGPGPMPPPPGIPARGVNPNFMMPMHGNIPPVNERPGFPRGSGPPPGMMPPPGYGPPPSGYPPMPPNSEPFMGPGPGGQGPFAGQPGPQGPPPSSRQLLDMFGQGGGEGRGNMVGPGQYR